MKEILAGTRDLEASLESIKELLIGNAVLLGEVPSYAGTWQSDDEMGSVDYSVRARFFADRLSELGVDECTTDVPNSIHSTTLPATFITPSRETPSLVPASWTMR